MEPSWWGIVAVVVIGSALVWYGWWNDRRLAREAEAAAHEATSLPSTPATTPGYVTDRDVATVAFDPSLTSADADLIARRDAEPSLPAGAVSGAFLNRPSRGLAVWAAPTVAVLSGSLTADRDVTTLLLAAGRRGRPLVVVASDFSASALATFNANLRKGTLAVLPVALEDPTARRRAVALTGGHSISAEDLASGWLPDRSWGSCDGWIADLDDSWILVSGRSPEASDDEPR